MKHAFMILGFIVFLFSPSYADIYKYTDEDGIVCYTDTPLSKIANLVMREKTEANQSQPNTTRKISQDSTNYHSLVHEKATKYKIDPLLVNAVIKTESNWNEWAISKKGAMGLMQLMPATARELKVSNPFNPEENIEGGVRYLRYLLERFNGDLTLALAAYNAGPTWVEKFGVIPPITETKQYVRKVLSLYNGNTAHPLTELDSEQDKPERVYKVVLKDGTVLFTNSTFLVKDTVGF
jgi:hypothetical protein